MSFKIIADILTMPFEGDFTGDMDPYLKKAFGRAEKKRLFFFFPALFNSSKSEELNTPNFLIGLD